MQQLHLPSLYFCLFNLLPCSSMLQCILLTNSLPFLLGHLLPCNSVLQCILFTNSLPFLLGYLLPIQRAGNFCIDLVLCISYIFLLCIILPQIYTSHLYFLEKLYSSKILVAKIFRFIEIHKFSRTKNTTG